MRQVRHNMPRVLLAALLGCLLGACGDTKLEADYPVEVYARADGVGVEGAVVKLNDEEIGQTDEEGRFEGTFHGTEEDEISLEVLAPEDFRLADDTSGSTVTKLAAERPEEGDPTPKAVSVVVDLKPTSMDYVLLVDAPGKHRPIYLNDELRDRTNPRGAQVVHFRGSPGETMEVRLDTRSKKYSPLVKRLALGEDERVFILDKSDEVTETEEEKQTRATVAQEREAKAMEVKADRARRRGGRSAERAARMVASAPKEEEQSDAEDLAVVRAVSDKAARVVEAAAATPPPVAPTVAAAPPVEEMPFDRKQAAAITKALAKDVRAVGQAQGKVKRLKGKFAALARKPGGEAVAAPHQAIWEASVTRLGEALVAMRAAQKAAGAAAKAKDMTELLTQERAGKAAMADVEMAVADAEQALTAANEQVSQAVAAAKAAEEQARSEAAEAERLAKEQAAEAARLEKERLEAEKALARENEGKARADATAALADALAFTKESVGTLKGLARDAKKKASRPKHGKAEARAQAKEINARGKAVVTQQRALTGLQRKVKRAKPETLPEMMAKARDARAAVEQAMAAAQAAMAKLDAAIAEPVAVAVAVAPPEPAAPTPAAPGADAPPVKKPKPPRGGRKPKPGAEKPKPGGKKACPPDLECEYDELQSSLEDGSLDRCLVQVCEKVPVGGPNSGEIHLALAKYWGRKKKRSRQLKALERATAFGQYKYDPNVLYGYIKVAVAARRFSKAIEIKDRFMQVKERLPGAERKRKVSDILAVLAQAYEHEFYRKQEKQDDQDFTPLLNKAVQFWEEYGAYSGDMARAKKKIEELKKLREETL